MSQKSRKRKAPLKKALPLLPEEERELFPGGKPEHPEKLMRDAGNITLFTNRNVFTKRAFYLIRNYWRLGRKLTAIIMTALYLVPFVVIILFGFVASTVPDDSGNPFMIVAFVILGIWTLIYYIVPNIMVWHQLPIYQQFHEDYNKVRHQILHGGEKKKR